MSPGDSRRTDSGSAPAEFAMIAGLVVLVALALMQLVLALHVRATLMSSASEGARHGAHADRDPADGAARALELAGASLPGVEAKAVATQESGAMGDVVRVTMTARVPVVGLWGPERLTVSARALDET